MVVEYFSIMRAKEFAVNAGALPNCSFNRTNAGMLRIPAFAG
jgi:hypothetical protein